MGLRGWGGWLQQALYLGRVPRGFVGPRMLAVRRRLGAMSDRDWMVFDLAAELEKLEGSGSPYAEFLRVPALSCGVYSLPAGSRDLQGPHDEDEVYFVVNGRGRLRVEGEEREVMGR